jgi:DNA-binding transcriptional MerR regulator
VSTLTIGEIAERSGFSTSALRYYEGIGLLVPATRTDGGYRVYDDHALTRLAFIARAKQLGCSLDEITVLVRIWDGEQCGPVQRRFHELVTDKIADSQLRIAELTAFTAQLQTAAGQLNEEPVDGACSDACACVTATAIENGTVQVTLGTKPSDPPIECTLEPGAMPDRLADWRAILERARTRTTGPNGALRLEFGAGTDLAELARLVDAEQRCCAFFSFAITVDPRGVALEVRAPDGAAEVVTSLFGQPI